MRNLVAIITKQSVFSQNNNLVNPNLYGQQGCYVEYKTMEIRDYFMLQM